jgi:hypothetical protein
MKTAQVLLCMGRVTSRGRCLGPGRQSCGSVARTTDDGDGSTVRPNPHGPRPWFQSIAAPPDKDGKLTGRLVVKVNGQGVEVKFLTTTVR